MGACYGDGILGFIPGGIDGDEAKAAFVREFAALGLSHRFHEIVGDRVVELAFKRGDVSVRWLSDKDAAPIFAAQKRIGGSAPYSMFPICMQQQLYIPGCRSGGGGQVQMPGSPLDGWSFNPMRTTITDLEGWLPLVERKEVRGDVDFLRELLEQLKLCSEHRLLFTIGN
jgi:hypothetical protein